MKFTKEKHTKQIGTCKSAVEISWCNCRAPYLARVLPKEGGFLKPQPSLFLFFSSGKITNLARVSFYPFEGVSLGRVASSWVAASHLLCTSLATRNSRHANLPSSLPPSLLHFHRAHTHKIPTSASLLPSSKALEEKNRKKQTGAT